MLLLPAKLSRYAAVATLLLKHHSAADDAYGDYADYAEAPAPDLEKLGPTFVKRGQVPTPSASSGIRGWR